MKNTNAALERIELAKWCKKMEIEALEKSHRKSFDYYQGKAIGFAQVWEYIVFDGVIPSAHEYNQADAAWSDMVEGTIEN